MLLEILPGGRAVVALIRAAPVVFSVPGGTAVVPSPAAVVSSVEISMKNGQKSCHSYATRRPIMSSYNICDYRNFTVMIVEERCLFPFFTLSQLLPGGTFVVSSPDDSVPPSVVT